MMTNEEKKRVFVRPDTDFECGCSDDGNAVYTFKFEIPGAKKEKIDLKVIKDGIRLIAPRSDAVDYYSEVSFCCEAFIDEVSANYDSGMLTVEVPMDCPDPFAEAKQITVS